MSGKSNARRAAQPAEAEVSVLTRRRSALMTGPVTVAAAGRGGGLWKRSYALLGMFRNLGQRWLRRTVASPCW